MCHKPNTVCAHADQTRSCHIFRMRVLVAYTGAFLQLPSRARPPARYLPAADEQRARRLRHTAGESVGSRFILAGEEPIGQRIFAGSSPRVSALSSRVSRPWNTTPTHNYDQNRVGSRRDVRSDHRLLMLPGTSSHRSFIEFPESNHFGPVAQRRAFVTSRHRSSDLVHGQVSWSLSSGPSDLTADARFGMSSNRFHDGP